MLSEAWPLHATIGGFVFEVVMGRIISSKDKYITIALDYNGGLSSTELSQKYGVSSETILRALRFVNILRRPSNNARPKIKDRKQCTCCGNSYPNNATYFKKKGKTYVNGDPKLRSECRFCNRKKYRDYTRNRKNKDPDFKLRKSLSSRMRRALSQQYSHKAKQTMELIGCTVADLKKYLEIRFEPGMSWNNYGSRGWTIDHIIPCASFDLTQPEEQKKCFHYTNLQPMWWLDNSKKNSVIDGTKITCETR